MDRVSLLVKKGETDYNLIKKYFDERNKVAHGGIFSFPIDIQIVISDMKNLYKKIKKVN